MMDEAAIARIVNDIFDGARVDSVSTLRGGLSAASWVVGLENGLRVVVRMSRSARSDDAERAERQFRLFRHLSRTPVPAPRGLHLDIDGEGGTLLVLEYIDGNPPYFVDDAEPVARAMADKLRVVHATPPIVGLGRMTDRMKQRLAIPPAPRPWASRAYGRLVQWTPPSGTNLLHGDFWPGNVLWDGRQITGIIDWEDVAIGDPLCDVAISRVDLHVMFGPATAATFTQRYGVGDAHRSVLARWDLAAAMRFAGWIPQIAAGWPALGRPDLDEHTLAARLETFAETALSRISP